MVPNWVFSRFRRWTGYEEDPIESILVDQYFEIFRITSHCKKPFTPCERKASPHVGWPLRYIWRKLIIDSNGSLSNILLWYGWPDMLINLIWCFMSSSSMKMLWNGEVLEEFRPSKGICKGVPLSFYTFVLCIERIYSNDF